MPLIILPAPPGPQAVATFWCGFHGAYDTCCLEYSCEAHPLPRISHSYRSCICDGKAWTKFNPEDPTCRCGCHQRQSTWLNFPTCSPCCRERRVAVDHCECICHTEFAVDCGTYSLCCQNAKRCGETDRIPRTIDPFNFYPWNTGPRSRRKGGNMTENIHLNMTVTGDIIAVDLFHIMLEHVDNDYPIKAMRKKGDKIPICAKCHGYIWKNACLGPAEIYKAAAQAAAASSSELKVKVHRWFRAKNCGCTDETFVIVGADDDNEAQKQAAREASARPAEGGSE